MNHNNPKISLAIEWCAIPERVDKLPAMVDELERQVRDRNDVAEVVI
jgi:hypothetical protein